MARASPCGAAGLLLLLALMLICVPGLVGGQRELAPTLYLSDQVVNLTTALTDYNKTFTLKIPHVMAVQVNVPANSKYLTFGPTGPTITVGNVGSTGLTNLCISVWTAAALNQVNNTLTGANDTARESFYGVCRMPAGANIFVIKESQLSYSERTAVMFLSLRSDQPNGRGSANATEFTGGRIDLTTLATGNVGTTGGPLYIVYQYMITNTGLPTVPVEVSTTFSISRSIIPPSPPTPPPPSPPKSATRVGAPSVLVTALMAAACMVLGRGLLG
mmetsp:Transcript_15411/g.33410  ORF Transcript_15411/g.33410 Transcript_15411/m.33410 type:complete len:274 (+) Transcript_15411:94-915(+)|eukprot:CAMPEP_0202921808 /NCGR_PEP_ID=MMETSP1392-20130828/77592_1 /ASSEMBLY_ACC=CAM_ASM_000868 /TAXON_ID=225041 /ORGANISM="Chlamydomonas chlamydogama, Strain SAG 11-48b" /LENGTH=273 /DNA_ID=CAMNT_0049615405 /DNA_START=58 /DNA_END=879 /DNA_ORIENTATION=-